MKKHSIGLSTAQFAKLHEVNKRTLHYYDAIGLFCPQTKKDNGYRCYDISQSMDFEYIRMLKELNMSIKEIETYRGNPTPAKFLTIADQKLDEIDMEIQKLKKTKKILQAKKEQVLFCKNLPAQEIRIEECNAERICILPYDFAEDNVSRLFAYVKNKWGIEQICMGIGSFISLDKIIHHTFEPYDGIYTFALGRPSGSESLINPKGRYLCGYQTGAWDTLPAMYEKMIAYAKQGGLELTGYAYELGLNEFVISAPEEYITKIMIKIQE